MQRAKTNAERQAAFRHRHLASGASARLSIVIAAIAHAQLGRLALHRGTTVTALIEDLAEIAERAVIGTMSDSEREVYFGE